MCRSKIQSYNIQNTIKNIFCLIPINMNASSNETIVLFLLLFTGIISYAYSQKIKENLPDTQIKKTETMDTSHVIEEITNGTLTSQELQYYFFTYLSIFCFSTFFIYLIYILNNPQTNDDSLLTTLNTPEIINLKTPNPYFSRYSNLNGMRAKFEYKHKLEKIQDAIYHKHRHSIDYGTKPLNSEEIQQYANLTQGLQDIYLKNSEAYREYNVERMIKIRDFISQTHPSLKNFFIENNVYLSPINSPNGLENNSQRLLDSLDCNEFVNLSFFDYVLKFYELTISTDIFFEI